MAARTKRAWAAFAAFLAANALVSLGRAAEPEAEGDTVVASLELLSTPGCGEESALARAIVSRSERIVIDPERRAPRLLRVELRESGGGLRATLTLTQPSGRRSLRTLRAATCDEALDAVALVAAVSLDPTASAAPGVAPAPSESPAAAPAKAPIPAPVPRSAEASVERRARFEASFGLAFEALSGPAPALMPGFGASGFVAYERDSVLSPALRVSYSHAARGGFRVAGGTAEFALDAATLELCPLRAQSGPLRVYPCLVRLTGGELEATGSDTTAPRARGRPWWVVGSSLFALLRPTRSLELTLTLAAGRPLIRDRFQFEPLEFHRVSALAATAALGVGVAFP